MQYYSFIVYIYSRLIRVCKTIRRVNRVEKHMQFIFINIILL